MNATHRSESGDDAVDAAAALWLARCDRGLTPTEQDAFLEWMRADPGHAAAVARLRGSWARLDQLAQWQPAHGATPDPDLLAPAPRRRWTRVGVLAAAALVVLAGVLFWQARHGAVAEQRFAKILPGPERVTLADGSLVELNAGAVIDVRFSRAERRVRLVSGEALFNVAKDPACPFIVDTGACEVRAVGTAFCVELRAGAVAVLVTEGAVRLDDARRSEHAALVPSLVAGQQAIVAGATVDVQDMSPAEIDAALAWRGIRLEFEEMPLRDVIVEFNRYNVRQLVLHDVATGEIRVGGSFRADHLDAFVRLLDTGFDVAAEAGEREIVLRHRR